MSQALSRAQRRRKKLAERRQRLGLDSRVAPYEGGEYRAPEYAEVLFTAERAILDCYTRTGGAITDSDVLCSLEYLVLDLRGQQSTRLPSCHTVELPDGSKEDMIAQAIKRAWESFFATEPRLGTHHLSGVLRTIMQSIGTRAGMSNDPRAYLHFLEKFLAQLLAG